MVKPEKRLGHSSVSKQFDVLVVEDEPVVLRAAKRILRADDLTTEYAVDAESAVERLSTHHYKVVLSDLKLPGASGFDLIDRVKESDPTAQFIVITGYATIENALEAFRLGAFDFIPKPFDPSELLGVVSRALRFRERSRAGAARHESGPAGSDLYSLGRHSWAMIDPDGSATLGVAETIPQLLGAVESIEVPEPDGHTAQGARLARIVSNGALVHRIWAPLSGQIIAVNSRLKSEQDLINTDPYHEGWLVRIIPSNLEEELPVLTQR